ncbi:MAG: asparagine synthase (glutamine-hydrolyzing) [Xanthobacteraceae bacterium]|nr:asparagine synthase (glutamine-hydrolyzing) [Xanthobacteraceae bacterium]
MCGISGFLWLGSGRPPFDIDQRLRGMIAPLRHRGPDDQGVWNDGVCGLAHARLSIIDLTPGGHQPMGSADGRVWISFNGEIYNFKELRAELQAKGYSFRSQSDTEVIIYGYLAWGERVVDRLRGMFAFALWDAADQKLLLVRDRLGKKPLCYARVGDALVFGSEIKAILAWPQVDRTPDYVAIDQYLSLQYVPAPRTAFASIRKLRNAHYLTVERSAGGWAENEQVQYWRLPLPTAPKTPASTADLAAELVDRLRESVKLRLISDVPLGAFLSGGVDSSSVVALMAGLGHGPVKTFSIGFPNKEYDETRYARMVAERYGTDHQEFIVEPDALSVLSRLVWHYGEPFADPSAVPTYYVSEIARRKVTVALNGDGGDEAFMGYGRYDSCRRMSPFDWMPPWMRKLSKWGIRALPQSVHERYGNRLTAFGDLIAGSDRRPSKRYEFTIVSFMEYMKQQGYTPAMSEHLSQSALDLLEPYFEEAPSLVTGANWADIHTYLPDNLMVKVDIASMAHGLESRSPLLDHTFMEWAMTIPESKKMAGGLTKAVFKKAMEPYLPHELLYRPKMGFGAPIDHWFRAELKDMAYDVLLSDSATARSIFRRDYVRQLLDEHTGGQYNHQYRLWPLLMLELWFRMWVDQGAEAAVAGPSLEIA